MNTWLPWIGTWIGVIVGAAIILAVYTFGERRGWWW